MKDYLSARMNVPYIGLYNLKICLPNLSNELKIRIQDKCYHRFELKRC